MTALSAEQAASREKTLLTAMLFSLPAPLVTGLAVLSSQSTTQIADFIRRSVQLGALIISWWVFRRIQHNAALDKAGQTRLERAAGLSVAGALLCSGAVMLILAFARLRDFEPGGNVIPGLTIAVLGLLFNTGFWWRYAALTSEHYSAVIAAQQGLYRAKAYIDLCVVAALATVAIAPTHPATQYVDVLGSIIVAGYLLWSGQTQYRANLRVTGELPGDPPSPEAISTG